MTRRLLFLFALVFSFHFRTEWVLASPTNASLHSFAEVGEAFVGLGFNGVAMVAEGDRVLWQAAYGQKDLADSTKGPLMPSTKFPIGSITKQFVSAMILKFQERGLLSIEDTLERFYPNYIHAPKIRLRHLMSHTAGIPNYTDDSSFWAFVQTHPYPSLEDLFSFFWNEALRFEPDAKHSYSNSGYVLLGGILEKVSGKDFGTLLKDEIFVPLAMADSFYDPNYDYEGESLPHEFDRDYRNVRASTLPLSWAHAAGGMVSTLEDMRRWNRALDLGLYISKESVALLAKPVNVPESYGYGLGLVTDRYKDYDLVWHTGGLPGFIAYSMRIPAKEVSLSIFTNTGDSYLRNQMMNALMLVTLEGAAPQPKKIPDLDLPPELLEKRTGLFECKDLAMKAQVKLEGRRLYLTLVNPDGSFQPELYMMPQSEKQFSLYSIATMDFGSTSEGLEKFDLIQSGQNFLFVKTE